MAGLCWGALDSCQILIGPLPPRCSGRAMSTLWLLLMLIALELKLRWRWRAADKIGFLHEIGALVECDRVSQRGVLSQQTFAIEIKTLSRVVCAIGTVFGVIGFLTCACSLDVGFLFVSLVLGGDGWPAGWVGGRRLGLCVPVGTRFIVVSSLAALLVVCVWLGVGLAGRVVFDVVSRLL